MPDYKALLSLFFLSFITVASAQGKNDVAMITAIQGTVDLLTPHGIRALQPFGRLQLGDQLTVNGATIKLVFLSNGRQEIWQGKGIIEIMASESRGLGLPAPYVKVLSNLMVKQIGKTPSDGDASNGRSIRLRSVGGGSVERVEDAYRRMRMEAAGGDLNPELFLLSALFEMREVERVEQVLADLRVSRPQDQEAKIVIALYQKAVRNFRESVGKQ